MQIPQRNFCWQEVTALATFSIPYLFCTLRTQVQSTCFRAMGKHRKLFPTFMGKFLLLPVASLKPNFWLTQNLVRLVPLLCVIMEIQAEVLVLRMSLTEKAVFTLICYPRILTAGIWLLRTVSAPVWILITTCASKGSSTNIYTDYWQNIQFTTRDFYETPTEKLYILNLLRKFVNYD